jgi:hypothetical protein
MLAAFRIPLTKAVVLDGGLIFSEMDCGDVDCTD